MGPRALEKDTPAPPMRDRDPLLLPRVAVENPCAVRAAPEKEAVPEAPEVMTVSSAEEVKEEAEEREVPTPPVESRVRKGAEARRAEPAPRDSCPPAAACSVGP